MPAKRRHVVWAPRAKRDLADVWRYYARVASIEVADKLLREIDDAARRLSDDALRWRARDELMPGLRSALVPPYVIFYRPERNGRDRPRAAWTQEFSGDFFQNRRLSISDEAALLLETDSLYVELASTPSAEAREIVEGLVADFDANGNVVGLDRSRVPQARSVEGGDHCTAASKRGGVMAGRPAKLIPAAVTFYPAARRADGRSVIRHSIVERRRITPSVNPPYALDGFSGPNRSDGGAISVTRSRTSFLLGSGVSVISRGSRRVVQA